MKKKLYYFLIFIEYTVVLLSISLLLYGIAMLSYDNQNKGRVFLFLQHESDPRIIKDIGQFEEIESRLSHLDNCKYYEIYIQPIHQNVFGSKDQEVIQAIQISENVQEDFKLNLAEGRKFSKSDFSISENKIPVILGHNFSDLLHVGDSFIAEYLFDEYEFEVIGILQPHPGVDVINGIYFLDDRIIMPSFWISNDSCVTDGIKIHYANKTSGKIETDERNAPEVLEEIQDIIEDTPAGEYSVNSSSLDYNIKSFLGLSIRTIVILNFVIICITSLLLLKTLKKLGSFSFKEGVGLLVLDLLACFLVLGVMEVIGIYFGIHSSKLVTILSAVYPMVLTSIRPGIR